MKKLVKSFIAVLMVLFFFISGFSSVNVNAKSKEKKLLSVSVSAGAMIKGDSKKLDISPKGTKIKSIKSSKKNVIKVTSKGKITALKSGTSTITVTSKDGNEAKITIKVFKAKSDMIVNRKINGKKALWHIKSGKVVKKSGFATDGIDWYYAEKGKVSKKTGIFSGKVNGVKAKWYVKKGKVGLTINDNVYVKGYTYKLKNGKVIKKAKGKIDAFFGDIVELSSYDKKVIGNANLSVSSDAFYPETAYMDCILSDNGKETGFFLYTDNNKKYVGQLSYLGNYNIEYVDYTKNSCKIRVTPKKAQVKKPMSISGKATDHYVTKDYEYIESDNIIIFMNKGVKFDGNLLAKYEEYKKVVEKVTGLSDKHIKASYNQFVSVQNEIYGTNVFDGVDTDMKKIHIYINDNVHPHCDASRGYYSYIALDSISLDVNDIDGLRTEFIHEYTHYLHLTNAPGFNPITNEGYASYIEILGARELISKDRMSDEEFFENYTSNYVLPTGRITKENAESTFAEGFPDGIEHSFSYNYGFVLMQYIHQTYGKDAFKKLFEEGQAMLDEQRKTSTYCDLNGKNTAELYKKVYSKTFFSDFMNWLEKHPEYEADFEYSMD